MRKLFAILFITLMSSIASAQYPNFEGSFFSGEENFSFELIRVDIPWSNADFLNNITLEACGVGDGAIVLFEREEFVIISSGVTVPLGGIEVYSWNPSAHAYVHEEDRSNQGHKDVGILVFKNDTVTLIDGIVYFDGVGYTFFDTPQWEWLDFREYKAPVRDEESK